MTFPGLRRAHHVAFTVPDLDQAVDFFTTVIDGVLLHRYGPVRNDGDWMHRQLDVHPRATAEIAMVRLPGDLEVELFEYTAPGQNRAMPSNSDWGGHHLALHVEDLDQAVDHLRRHQVQLIGDPQTVQDGHPIARTRWIYFVTPWGLHMELIAPAP